MPNAALLRRAGTTGAEDGQAFAVTAPQPPDEPLACGKRSLSVVATDAWEMDRPMNGDGKARLVGIRAAIAPLLAAIVALPGCGTPKVRAVKRRAGVCRGEQAGGKYGRGCFRGTDTRLCARPRLIHDRGSSNGARADARADPAAAVLGLVLRQDGLPAEGWRRVIDTASEVLFVVETPEDEAPYAFVSVVRAEVIEFGRDGWTADSYGACTPRPVVPNSQSLAPRQRAPRRGYAGG